MVEINDVDKHYLDSWRNHGYGKYLEFMITINSAIYVALYFVNEGGSYWQYSFEKFFLALVLSVVNLMIYIIYWREHSLKDIVKKKTGKFYKEYLSDPVNELREDIVNEDKTVQKNEYLTWFALKILISFFTTVPIIYLIILLCSLSCSEGLSILKARWVIIVLGVIVFPLLVFDCVFKLFKKGCEKLKKD